MRNSKAIISGTGLGAAIGAGLAAALLSMMPALKNPAGLPIDLGGIPPVTLIAMAMAFIAPLPIMLAALGFGSVAGLIAAIVGAIAVGIVDLRPDTLAVLHISKLASGGLETLVFAVSFGLPSWMLSRAVTFTPGARLSETLGRVRPDEVRLGLVLSIAALFAAFGAALDIGIAMKTHGGFQAFMDASATQIEPLLTLNKPLPQGVDAHRVAVKFVYSAMGFMSAADMILLVVNLWVAARIAQLSNLLPVPWPDIPASLRVPRLLAILLAVALGLSFAGGPVGMIGVIVSGALLMAFLLQGLAVVHALTRGKSFRLPLLIIVYLTLIWTVALYALLGLVDAALAFRDRQKPTVKKIP